MSKFYRHCRRGGVYQVIAMGDMRNPRPVKDMSRMVWVDDYAVVWTRPLVPGEIEAVAQCDDPMLHGARIVLYRDKDSRYWVRPHKEFFDGRFEPLDEELQPVRLNSTAHREPDNAAWTFSDLIGEPKPLEIGTVVNVEPMTSGGGGDFGGGGASDSWDDGGSSSSSGSSDGGGDSGGGE